MISDTSDYESGLTNRLLTLTPTDRRNQGFINQNNKVSGLPFHIGTAEVWLGENLENII